MDMPMRSRHAIKRMRQRGISDLAVQVLEVFGEPVLQKDGVELLITPKRLAEACEYLSQRNICAVVRDGHVLTVEHRIKPLRKK